MIDSTFFTFYKKYYKQIFGTPMNFPLSSILVDIILHDIEEVALNRPLISQSTLDDILYV